MARGGIGAPPEVVVVGDWPLPPVGVRWNGTHGRCVAVASRSTKELVVLDLSTPSQPVVKLQLVLADAPRALTAGDLDGDGNDEIVVATDGASLHIVHSDGSVNDHPLRGKLPRCLAILSRNSVTVGFQDEQELDVYADLTRDTDPSAVLALDGFPRALLAGDLDGDGDRELAVVGGDHSLWIWGLGTKEGSRSWLEAGRKPLTLETAPIPIALVARDLDGDGAAELIVGCYYGVCFEVWSHFRSGQGELVQEAYVGQTPVALQVLDLDGDGHADLAAAARDAHALSWLRGDGTGRFRTPLGIGTGRFPRVLAAGNLDGAGGQELAVIDAKENALSILAVDGEHGIERQRLSLSSDPRALCCADCDGDGLDELLVAVQDSDGAHLRTFAQRGGQLVERTVGAGTRLGAETSALLAGGSDDERGRVLLAADAQTGQLSWFSVKGERDAPLVVSETARLALLHGPCALAWCEQTPRGIVAVALGGPGERRGVSLVALEGGALHEVLFMPSEDAPHSIACEDLDGDGLADLAVLELTPKDPVRGHIRLWMQKKGEREGEIAFTPGGEFPCGLSPQCIAASRAFAANGAQIFVASQDGHDLDAWRISAQPTATDEPRLRVQRLWGIGAGLGCVDVHVVDMHGDGRVQLAVVNAASDEISIIGLQAP